jgi:hypothetical protein
MSDDLDALAENIKSAEDLATFIARFAVEVERSPEQWSNVTLATFLEELSAWISASDHNPDSAGYKFVHEPPSWKSFAKVLLVAAM